ncbi:MAG: ABC-type sugar transport system substrate-binding protein [Verrucomicrobiales bacterium]
MVPLLLDENFNGRIFRAMLRKHPDLDAVRVQDAGLMGADDPEVLEWAVRNGRVVVSHDVNTMPGFAYDRMADGIAMGGLVLVPEDMPIGPVIEELLILVECLTFEEFQGKVEYLPL